MKRSFYILCAFLSLSVSWMEASESEAPGNNLGNEHSSLSTGKDRSPSHGYVTLQRATINALREVKDLFPPSDNYKCDADGLSKAVKKMADLVCDPISILRKRVATLQAQLSCAGNGTSTGRQLKTLQARINRLKSDLNERQREILSLERQVRVKIREEKLKVQPKRTQERVRSFTTPKSKTLGDDGSPYLLTKRLPASRGESAYTPMTESQVRKDYRKNVARESSRLETNHKNLQERTRKIKAKREDPRRFSAFSVNLEHVDHRLWGIDEYAGNYYLWRKDLSLYKASNSGWRHASANVSPFKTSITKEEYEELKKLRRKSSVMPSLVRGSGLARSSSPRAKTTGK